MTRHARVAALLVAVLLIGTLAACGGGSSTSSSSALTVDTSSGRLHGIENSQVRAFLGVRYAESPTGSRRWADPVAEPTASGTVQATKLGPNCLKPGTTPGDGYSEDCLNLNVITPRHVSAGAKLPVMVWWHGGSFTGGSGNEYDPQRLVTRGHVIVVTVNYRLGVFGYLALPGLTGSGDFGLADQLLATRWAQRNAAAFGGDPHNITVFGESAGAGSACAALTSPAARGLIDKAALASGSCEQKFPAGGLVPNSPAARAYVPLAEGEQFGVVQAAKLGCTGTGTVRCLRGKSAAALVGITGAFSGLLAWGTPLLPRDPATALAAGDVPKGVRVISGGTLDEERAFVGPAAKADPGYYTATHYPALLRKAFGSSAARVQDMYPLARYPNAAVAFAAVITDSSWACPTLSGNAALAKHHVPVYGYQFADTSAPNVNGASAAGVPVAAGHATDLPYLFDLDAHDLLTTVAQRTLSNAMIDYWSSFARSGVPHAASQPAWPRLTGSAGPTLQLASPIGHVDIAAEHRCAFWSSLGY